MPFAERREAYACDVTYGTNSEFGFDYLRDNMAVSLDGVVQRSHAFAIVDEVDSILIDEARTPLIISGEPETAAATYYQFARVVKELEGAAATRKTAKGEDETELSGADYLYDEKFKTVSPAQSAIEKVERALGIENLYDPRNVQPRQPPHAGAQGASRSTSATSTTSSRRARSRSSTSSRAGSWKAAAGARASTRRSRPRRASGSARRTSRSRRSRSRTTSASTRSSPG